ncbi:glycosyl transferase family 2 [Paenibacillus pectinilyticus]|uniref:Glycosyl transferase family 2 n=1 Tax=Paenibacillus pectinilyticus TaxID=512399 RepID=A0A1C1A1D4_9BACL|nr:glycosyltransferase [Paenibacillus pectinilyticus]OCT14337.1 glycosyl transferase family 2 [Paenibacillus pectinilyticus]
MRNRLAKVTLSMIVKNESHRYLRSVLTQLRDWVDEAVIVDDGSTDDTVDICQKVLAHIPLKIIRNQQSQFSNEVNLRKQQWEETIATQPEWILNLDADEWMESRYQPHLDAILSSCTQDAIYLRLFDMWSETHYRDDVYWSAHNTYRPFLIRYKPGFPSVWHEVPQHCGRFPASIHVLPYFLHPCRIKHLGWSNPADRIAKYRRYMELDPNAKYGWKEQYDSILDESPHLVAWQDE